MSVFCHSCIARPRRRLTTCSTWSLGPDLLAQLREGSHIRTVESIIRRLMQGTALWLLHRSS